MTYCDEPEYRGLTCARENLVLLRRLSEDQGPTWNHIMTLYQCQVCRGFYKYIYSSRYLWRNFDQDEGWFEYDDRYYKVGGRNGAGSLVFPLKEARIYGYRGEEPG